MRRIPPGTAIFPMIPPVNPPKQPALPGMALPPALSAETAISGELIHRIYSNPENGYGVARLRRSSAPEEIVIAGNLSGAMEGMQLEVRGQWTAHPEHGRQFQVRECTAALPVSAKGVERFLASGVIPGISKRYAERIVRRFGTQTMEILDHAPERLAEIPGFGARRIAQIRSSWQKQHANRDTLVFLQGLGISPALCKRIVNRYTAAAAAETVRRNPYRLASDIDGIGFLTADRIAAAAGTAPDSQLRLSAGVLHCLENAAEEGHVALPPEELTEKAGALLKCSAAAAARGVDTACGDGRIVHARFPAGSGFSELYYTRRLYAAEAQLAARISLLLAVPPPPFPAGGNTDGGDLPPGPELNPEQLAACRQVKNSAISIITGGPGVGKTTVIAQIVREARTAGLRVRLTAPTGRAARRLGESAGLPAATIHRLLQYDHRERRFSYNEDNPLPADIIIADEVSMLDILLANALFNALRPGMRIVLVGDRDQLPPVGPGCVLKDLIACARIPVTALVRIYRQREGSRIISGAHEVNHGRLPPLDNPPRGVRSDLYFYEKRDPAQAANFICRLVAAHIPAFFGFNPLTEIQVLCPMHRGECGIDALNSALQNLLNPPAEDKPQIDLGGTPPRCFRLGDRVMQLCNNYDKQIFNGEMGQITAMNAATQTFSVLFDQSQVNYKADEAAQLTLCYAVTIHKSQGSEFPAVILPMLDQHHIMLQRNLLYTGMTRAKKLLVITGSRFALQAAVRNNTPARRISMLAWRLRQ